MPQILLTRRPAPLKNVVRSAIAGGAKIAWPFIPKAFYVGKVPIHLNIALTRKCNANCVFCAYQYASKSDKIHMPDTMFERLIGEIRELGIKSVMLSPNIGEPTIAPKFIEKLRQMRASGIEYIEMTSNALYFHKIGLEQLIEHGPNKINISFAGFDKDMYERDYRVYRYEETRNNILGLLRLNHERGRPKMICLWLRGDQPIEKQMAAPEMEEVRKYACEITAMSEVDDWLGLIKADALPAGYKVQTDRPSLSSRPCAMLFDLTVHPDGDVHLCACRNVNSDPALHIGNLNQMSLIEAHSKIANVLENWRRGRVPHACQTCSMYGDPSIGFAGRFRAVRSASTKQA
jgi:radical SAM protein with 4Fe4S-binding SPASM domain